MRQIKFRGKKHNSEWVYGSLVYSNNIDTAIHYEIGAGEVKRFGWCYVDSDTVGQYTGLKDNNGKEIYEGDILRSPLGNIVSVEFGYKEHIVKHWRPQITDGFACYGWIARNVKNGITDFFDNEFAAGEVIGNIYDNQDLLNQK